MKNVLFILRLQRNYLNQKSMKLKGIKNAEIYLRNSENEKHRKSQRHNQNTLMG